MKKTQRHDPIANNQPPTRGPAAEATPPKPDQAPMARERSSGRKLAWRMARLPGVSRAPPTPCTIRAPMSSPAVGARPQQAEARANQATPMEKTRRRP